MSEYGICGVVCDCGPNLEPLACGYGAGHSGPHAWASLPTFPLREARTLLVVEMSGDMRGEKALEILPDPSRKEPPMPARPDPQEDLPEVVIEMWNLIEEAWLSDGKPARHQRAIVACADFTDRVASHEVYDAARRVWKNKEAPDACSS